MAPDSDWWNGAAPDDLQGVPRTVPELEAEVRRLRRAARFVVYLVDKAGSNAAAGRAALARIATGVEKVLAERPWAKGKPPPPLTRPK